VQNWLKKIGSFLVSIIIFIASVAGIATWLGLTLHLGDIYLPSPIIVVVALLITALLFASAIFLGINAVYLTLLVTFLGASASVLMERYPEISHTVTGFKKIGSFLVSIIVFIASVAGIATLFGLTLHLLGDMYVPNLIIIVASIIIVALLFAGFFVLSASLSSHPEPGMIPGIFAGIITDQEYNRKAFVIFLNEILRAKTDRQLVVHEGEMQKTTVETDIPEANRKEGQ
jgi:hypothetical protein